MRKCPRCGKEYDDSWKVCLSCRSALTDSPPQAQAASTREGDSFKDERQEMADIRAALTKLNERLNLLEYNLSQKEGKAAPQQWKAAPARPAAITGKEAAPSRGEIEAPIVEPWTERPPRREEKAKQIEAPTVGPKEPLEPWTERPPRREEKSRSETFERVLGERWFNKLGILAVVVGVALLVGYSFRYLGPAGKIAIGYAFGAGLVAFGSYIERKKDFSVYGKTLIGGGWAIAYFTTFAMHHIKAVQLVRNPFLGFLLLLGVSFATVLHIYRYKSETATVFSYLLTFITLMIAPVSLFTMTAAALVAVSLVYFMLRNRWAYFALYGMAMTYATYWCWMVVVSDANKGVYSSRQFFIAISFLMLYWAIFVIATLLMKEDREKEAPAAEPLALKLGIRDLIHIANTCIASVIAWSLLAGGFTKYIFPTLWLGIVLYTVLTAVSYRLKQRSLCLISSTAAIVYAALYLFVKYTGYPLTAYCILLAQIVLLLGVVLKEPYWRVLAFGFFLIILGKLMTVDSFVVKSVMPGRYITSHTLIFAFAFTVYLLNHFLYSKLKEEKALSRPERLHPRIISYAYPAIYMMGTWLDLPKVLTAPCWSILGVVLLQFGVLKDDNDMRTQGYILGVGSFLRLLMSNMTIEGGISIVSYRILTTVPVLCLIYYCVALLQDTKTMAILKGRERRMIGVYPYMFFIGLMFLSRYELPKDVVAPAWAAIAIIYSVRAVYSQRAFYLAISSLAAISAGVRAIFVNLLQGKYLLGAEGNLTFAILTICGIFLGDIFYIIKGAPPTEAKPEDIGRIRRFFRSPRLVFGLSAMTALTVLLRVKLSGVTLTVGLGMEGLLLLLAGFGLKERSWRVFGLVVLLLALFKAFLVDLRQLSTLYYILSLIALGIVLLFVSYVYTRHKDKLKKLI